MQKPNLNISVKLILANPNNIIITDNTNYIALGLDATKVKMNARIYTPNGALYVPAYYNTPQTTNDFSPTLPFDYVAITGVDAIPDFLIDTNGCFINGLYKVEIKWHYTETAETFEYTLEENIIFKKPTIDIRQFTECFCANFKSTDKTDYSNTIEISYLHTINYPSETNEPDTTITLKDYLDNRLANGTYVTEITTERVIIMSPIFSIQATLYGKKSIVVDCDSICEIKCGINTLKNKYDAACGNNLKEATRLKAILDDVLRNYMLMLLNNGCGNTSDSNTYLQNIKHLLGDCNCGCDDCGNDDGWITGVCGSSGSSDFDPTNIYNYIDNLNTAVTNLINNFAGDLADLTTIVNNLANQSWFQGLTIPACLNFLVGDTEIQKKDKVLAKICQLNAAIFATPVAKNDISTTLVNVAVSNLVTLNDFATSNVVVTITTAPINGTAVVQPDGKTIIYTPGTGFVGNDTVGYTITDANGQTSTAIWTITVNAVPAVSCSTVEASYSASFYPMGTFLQIAIQNLSSIGTNVLTAKNYIIEIRDVSNAILLSYSVTGSLTVDPTIFTTPVPFAANWNNVRIQQTITTQSATGAACGTVTYETPTPYLLTDVSLSWFYGTTISPCLGILDSDTEIEKKNKLMSTICKPIYVENGLTGNGLTGNPVKWGGDLTENTEVRGASTYKVEYKETAVHSVTTGGTVGASTEKDYSAHQTPLNYNRPNGYSLITRIGILRLNNYAMLNGSGVALKNNTTTISMGANETVENGSSVGNVQDYVEFNVEGDADVVYTQNSGGEPQTVRGAHNRGIYALLNSGHPTAKVTVNAFKNLEVGANGDNTSAWNVFGKFIQVYIGCAKGDGSITAPAGSLPDSYGIYQAGTADKNEFYGEIRYHSGLTNASDERSKKVTGDFTKGLEEILQISTILFKRREGFGNTDIEQVGIVAQELEKIIPEAIKTGKTQEIEDFKFFNPDVLIFALVNAVKEQNKQYKELESKYDKLEERFTKLEGKVNSNNE